MMDAMNHVAEDPAANADARQGSRRRLATLTVLLATLFLVSRIAVLIGSPCVIYDEEAKTGALGHDLVFEQTLRLPFFGYLDSPHAGGSLVAQLEVVPFYLVAGNRYLAIKLAALVNATILLVLGCTIVWRAGSRSGALLLAGLMIAGTPHLLQKSVMIRGNTVLLAILVYAALALVPSILQERQLDRSRARSLALLLGAGLWLQYSFISMVLLGCLVLAGKLWNSRDQVPAWTELLRLGGCLAAGLSPWLIYNGLYNFPSLFGDMSAAAHTTDLAGAPQRLVELVLVSIPRSLHFTAIGPIPAWLLDYTVLGLLLACATYPLVTGRSRLIAILRKTGAEPVDRLLLLQLVTVAYLVITVILTALLNLPVGNTGSWFGSLDSHHEYYLLPLQPVLLLAAAIGLGLIVEKHTARRRYLVPVLVACLVLMGFASLYCLGPYSRNHQLLHPMASTEAVAFENGFNLVLHPITFASFLSTVSYDDSLRYSYLSGAGNGLAHLFRLPVVPERTCLKSLASLHSLSIAEKSYLLTHYLEPLDLPPPEEKHVETLDRVLNPEDRKILHSLVTSTAKGLRLLDVE
jgi:hypothetical protein